VGDEGGVGIVFTNRYTLVNAKFAAKKTNTVILLIRMLNSIKMSEVLPNRRGL